MEQNTHILDAILSMLEDSGVAYRHLEHPPTRTSEESAAARGEAVRIGGKALVIRTGTVFRLFVLSAALRLDSGAIRRQFNTRQARFATPEELLDMTGLVPGSVPPFGRPILPFDLFVDPSIPANERIAFNAGSLTHSVIMNTEDYMQLASPQVLSCARRG